MNISNNYGWWWWRVCLSIHWNKYTGIKLHKR